METKNCKHVVQFSGGAASAYVAYLVSQRVSKEDIILLHHDTKAEDPDTARFINDVSTYLDIPITECSDGRSLWELIDQYQALPSNMMPFCTQALKQAPAEKFYTSLRKASIPFITYNGFGPEEWSRVQKATMRAEMANRKVRSLLFEENLLNADIKAIIQQEWKICLPNAYRFMKHNNCIPCYKAGKSSWKKVWKYYPDEFAKAVAREESTGHTVFKNISLIELALEWERGSISLFDEDEEDYGIPCMCAF
ncbi:phosphoadenosine phosphosulfate reductase family protein [Anaeromusa acidaminophila]|uniref:phosphoadenosine phosphosulfate reductase domain-containing protein n=1 Tax=Anaeromusa acidaminophila TaxID=81464 RepID=UPI0003742AD9|nr:phosphoadenosine phosphosulfate reductase family protein [Anaeromusa acidaminophila]